MVAEFVPRQSGSPINGEIPSLNSTMPGSQGRDGCLQNAPNGFMNQNVVMGPVSPGTPESDGFSSSNSFEISAHMKRKELFSHRKQREFIPDNKKDENYWDRRRRNNEAAKRSREKRRFNDMVLESRVVELTKENHLLKAQLDAIREEYGISPDNMICVEKVMASMPSNEQVLSITKRPKLSSPSPGLFLQNSQSPIPTSVIHQTISHPVMNSPPPSVSHSPSVSAHHLHLHHPHPAGSLHESAGYNHHHTHPHHHSTPHHEPEYRGPYTGYQTFASHYDHVSAAANNNALNLSSRSRARSRSRSGSRAQSPYEISSGSGSGDEGVSVSTAPLVTIPSNSVPDSNNSLPLKLRHKSHLGDKDAASALLSLQNIKQEPGPRASPPWDGEGSSDERDSGISLGAEWSGNSAAAAVAAMASVLHKQTQQLVSSDETDSENKHRLHSEIVRLSTEVATLKSLMIQNKAGVKSVPQH